MAKRIKLGISYYSSVKSVLCSPKDLTRFQTFRTISINDLTKKRKGYIKKEVLGYSLEEMYSVASDVANYYKFVPYVKKSLVHSKKENQFKADLIVGFPPLHEIYTSTVTLNPPFHVRSVCNDGRIFNYLLNEWKFSPGPRDLPQSCVIDFQVLFEFKSLLHSNVANLFFDLICEQMESAFIKEAKRRYGAPSIQSIVLSAHRS